MLELLQARERIGVPELARRLEIGERTVRRYAAMPNTWMDNLASW